MNNHIVITGATGLIGSELCKTLSQSGNEIIAISRNKLKAKDIIGDYAVSASWNELDDYIDSSKCVINLAGENIGSGKWTKDRKDRILQSRIKASERIIKAIGKSSNKPGVLVQASAIGYYGHMGKRVDNESEAAGEGFLSEVCQQWEASSDAALKLGLRRIILRTGIVLSKNGGAFPRMITPVKYFIGGKLGSGKQWISWIHIKDLIKAIAFLIDESDAQGAFNLTAPNAITNADFTRAIARLLKRPSIITTPRFALQIALGKEFAEEMLLGGRQVTPANLIKAGFKFKHETIESALREL